MIKSRVWEFIFSGSLLQGLLCSRFWAFSHSPSGFFQLVTIQGRKAGLPQEQCPRGERKESKNRPHWCTLETKLWFPVRFFVENAGSSWDATRAALWGCAHPAVKVTPASPSDQQLGNKSPYIDLRWWRGMWYVRNCCGFLYWVFFLLWFLYSSIYHHHFPFPICCDVWGLWPRHFDDPFCCMDGVKGEPDPLPEEWEWGNVLFVFDRNSET